MSKQVRLQRRAIRYLIKHIYERVDSSSSQFEIHFAFIDECFRFEGLKRFSKLEHHMRDYIYNQIDSDLQNYLACLERYGKE